MHLVAEGLIVIMDYCLACQVHKIMRQRVKMSAQGSCPIPKKFPILAIQLHLRYFCLFKKL